MPVGALEKYINIDSILKAAMFKLPFLRPEFLEKTNKCLIVLLVFILVLFLADAVMFNPSRIVKKKMEAASERAISVSRGTRALKEAKDYSYYSSVLSEKQVFGASSASLHESIPEIPVEIELVGIIPGNKPQAIIENKTTQAVYYVHKGDNFENFIVEDIDDSKAVLYDNGQRIELSFFYRKAS
jgi:type II secretory pathway component PulC